MTLLLYHVIDIRMSRVNSFLGGTYHWISYPKPGYREQWNIVESLGRVSKSNKVMHRARFFVFFIFSEFIIRLFISEASVVTSGAVCLRILSYGYLFHAFGMVIVQGFNGAGDTATPTKINFFCYWLLEIPLAWFLALSVGMAESGVYVAIVVAEAVMTVVGIILFRRGKWKERQV